MSITKQFANSRFEISVLLFAASFCPPSLSLAQQKIADDQVSSATLTEVVVTAQKKSEAIMDVPVPVAAITASDLVAANKVRLEDYFADVPGLTLQGTGSGQQQIAIRGITTGGVGSPTVGITVDDVPIGSSTILALGNSFVPDIDPGALSQIEVLRGPQGILYGASSIGGLVKYQTIDPSTSGFSGRAEAGLDSVHNGTGLGYVIRGSANLPLTDTIAASVSGFNRRDPGYIDDPGTGRKGLNQSNVEGGRVASVWNPSADWSIKASALLQDTHGHGSSLVQPEFGQLAQEFLPNTGDYDQRLRLYILNVRGSIGPVDLTAVSGYGLTRILQTYDNTPYAGSIAEFLFNTPAAFGSQFWETRKFTQELRASMSFGDHIDLLAGVFYDHEVSDTEQISAAASPITGAPAQGLLNVTSPTTFLETAAFTNVTVHFTDKFDVQVGGRISDIRQKYEETDVGPLTEIFYGLPSPASVPEIDTTDHPFTYLFTPRYKISPDLMLYARLASGYRAGAPNFEATLFQTSVPHSFKSDKTQDYEFGLKGSALNHRVQYDASLYYIKWNDIQIQVNDAISGFPYYSNGGGAKSQGIELSAKVRPTEGLTISGWIDFTDAVLTEALPANSSAIAASGDRLPYSSRFSGNLSIDQSFQITGGWKAAGGGTASYVGPREDIFATATTVRQRMGGYTQLNAYAALECEKCRISVYANNLADRRGVIGLQAYGFTGESLPNYIQPRTVGISVERRF